MDVARFVRIFEPDPSDDFVAKRTAAIKDLRTRLLRKKNDGALMSLASEVLGVFRDPPVIPNGHVAAIEASIKKHSQSFVRDDRDLEMSVCMMIAVVNAIQAGGKVSEGWATADVLATALWSGASFLPANPDPKLEEFRSQAIGAARQRILASCLETRNRHKVPEFGHFGDESLDTETFEAATAGTIDALRYNSALDREELDILWWVLAASSIVFEKPLASLSPTTRAITTGIELGTLLRGLPGQSHRNLSLRNLEEAEMLSLAGVVDALGDDRMALAASFESEALVGDAASVFPLLNAIRVGSSDLSGAEVPRSLGEWCARALLERAVLRIQYPEYRRL